MQRALLALPLLLLATPALAVPPAPVGWWTFEGPDPLVDRSGHWEPLTLGGDATVEGGALRLRAQVHPTCHSRATGWAGAAGYSGPPIGDKTLVAWVDLRDPSIRAGGVLSLDTRDDTDVFDAIVWAETVPGRWMAGSNYYTRTQPAVLEDETDFGLVQIARIDRIVGDEVEVTLCRNGRLLATYRDAPPARWAPENAEVSFGRRHTSRANVETGGLDGDVLEARIYATALDCTTVGALTLVR